MEDSKPSPEKDSRTQNSGQQSAEQKPTEVKPDKNVVVPNYVFLTEGYDPAKLKGKVPLFDLST